jgi:hypothetical protein
MAATATATNADLKDTIAGDPCFRSTRPIMADFVSNLQRFHFG